MRRRAWFASRLFDKPGASADKIVDARAMRRASTKGEAVLWALLRGRRLGGWKFRRQHVVAGYIVDFYCAELRLAVEVDGPVHRTQRAHDQERDADLGTLGLAILRVRNDDLLTRPAAVLSAIALRCETLAHTLPPPRGGRAGMGAVKGHRLR